MNEEIMNVNETEVENDYSLAVQDEDNVSVDGVYYDEDYEETNGGTGKGIAIGMAVTAAVAAAGFGVKKLIGKLKERKKESVELTDEEKLVIWKARLERDEAAIKCLEEKIKTLQEDENEE